MNRPDDEALKALLARRDPAAAHPVDPVTSPSARALLERVMSTPLTEQPTAGHGTGPVRSRRRAGLLAAAGVLVAGGVGYGLVTGPFAPTTAAPAPSPVSSSVPSSEVAPAAKPLALSVPDGGGAAGSCPMFEEPVLAAKPVAFRGKVTAVSGGTVTLAVDRWYRGGPAGVTQVELAATNQNAALDGVEFVVGKVYLVSAEQGVVAICGYSGEATPELQALYDRAFGG